MTVANDSVYDKARAQLAEWGIGELADDVIQLAQQGLDPNSFKLALRQTDSYKKRFAGNTARLQKGLRVLGEDEYLNAEERYREMLSDPKWGLPKDFYDSPDDFAKMIGADLGTEEVTARLTAIKTVITDGAMTGVLEYAKSQYDLTDGDLMALWLDPDRAEARLVARQAAASAIGAAAGRTGFGMLATTDAERLDALGYTAEEAANTFSELASMQELTQEVEAGELTTSRDLLLRAGFDKEAGALEQIQRTQASRLARFQGGGGFAESREGLRGLRSAET